MVRDIYEDDKVSRIMPGTKDKVSLGNKVYAQKRLLLCTVKKIYNHFVSKYPEAKIKLTSFYSLKPKWCIQLGKLIQCVFVHTTHSVCVCAINQNVVLLCDAIDKKRNELLQHLVCDTENKICMAHRCQNCPGIDGLLNKLMETFSDVDDEEPIHFQQWQSAGRTQIMTLFLPRFEFLQFLAEKLDHLSTYSYIAKAQAVYLRHR